MTKKKVVVIVDRDQYEYRALDPDVEIEVRDYNRGRDCEQCGSYMNYLNAFTKSIQSFSGAMYPREYEPIYFLCPECAAGRGITDRWIQVKREDTLREMLEHWRDASLDFVVHELKSEEAAAINNGGRDSQIEFLAGVGWKPEGGSDG